MATNNDFLKFSAYSIKDLITRKLSENSAFTDQIYEGSNLAILIDIISYMYQCLIYNLNSSASESMFSDTQIYQNISRLCNFIGYHPIGFRPAEVTVQISPNNNNADDVNQTICPYGGINTGLTDSNGKLIYFSMRPGISPSNSLTYLQSGNLSLTLVNGQWKLYATKLTASGTPYETFVLDGLRSDSANQIYIPNNGIRIFVDTGADEIESDWKYDPYEIFSNLAGYTEITNTGAIQKFNQIYTASSKVYSCYLNENKTYELKFGNGIIGKMLPAGAQIYVMYLDTNGFDGYVDWSTMTLSTDSARFTATKEEFGIDDDRLWKAICGGDASNILTSNFNLTYKVDTLTLPQAEQNVSEVREAAPNWFKMGNRLITKNDYEFFFKSQYSQIIDVKCMNNWDYLVTFYRWLYNLGISNKQKPNERDPYKYLSKARLSQYGYQYVDSADANNIYLWMKTSQDDQDYNQLKSTYDSEIADIKTLTTETYPLKPIDMVFDISFTPEDIYRQMLEDNNGKCTSDLSNSYLEITIADNAVYSTTMVMNNVLNIIDTQFDKQNCILGQTINYDDILNQIYGINGIEKVRTVYYPNGYPSVPTYGEYKTRACDGISFASWSNTELVDVGIDLEINNTTRTLQPFHFPRIAPSTNLKSKIKVIKKSMNTTNPVKF